MLLSPFTDRLPFVVAVPFRLGNLSEVKRSVDFPEEPPDGHRQPGNERAPSILRKPPAATATGYQDSSSPPKLMPHSKLIAWTGFASQKELWAGRLLRGDATTQGPTWRSATPCSRAERVDGRDPMQSPSGADEGSRRPRGLPDSLLLQECAPGR